MAVVITATVGSASANSFITLAEASSFMEARLNSSLWDAATTDSQNRSLVEATRELSAREWAGIRVDDTQALSWPRSWVVNPDSSVNAYYATTIVPQRVKDATAELAFQFIKSGTTDVASLDPNIGIIEKTVDVLTTRYAEPYFRAQGLERFPSVMRYIRPLLMGSGINVPLIRG